MCIEQTIDREELLKVADEAGFGTSGGFIMPPHAGHITKELEKFSELIIERQRSSGETVYQEYDPAKQAWFDISEKVYMYDFSNTDSPKRILFTAPQQSPIPDNLLSHQRAWCDGLARLIELETNQDDKDYWKHELNAMGDMYDDLAAPSAPIEAQQSVTQALEAAAKLVEMTSPEMSCQRAAAKVRALIPSTQAPSNSGN